MSRHVFTSRVSRILVLLMLCGQCQRATGGLRQLLQNYLKDGNLAVWLPSEVSQLSGTVKRWWADSVHLSRRNIVNSVRNCTPWQCLPGIVHSRYGYGVRGLLLLKGGCPYEGTVTHVCTVSGSVRTVGPFIGSRKQVPNVIYVL